VRGWAQWVTNQQQHPADFSDMIKKGVVSNRLIKLLLQGHNVDVVILLMIKFSFIVPILSEDASASQGHGRSLTTAPSFLVPSLFAAKFTGDLEFLESDSWTDRPCHTCYALFSLQSSAFDNSMLSFEDSKMQGFLPTGTYPRLVAKMVAASNNTKRSTDRNFLSLNCNVLYYGNQRFRFTNVPGYNLTRIDIEGKSPLALKDRILDQVHTVLDENMKTVKSSVRVPWPKPDGQVVLVSLDAIIEAADNHDGIRTATGRELISAAQVSGTLHQ
jgi:hypothetical protein